MTALVLGAIVFVAVYVIIAAEWWHKTVAALVGGLLMILLGVLSQEEAFAAVDWNVIFLLAGMMIIAHITAETGVFQWLAIRAVKLADGRPTRLLLILSVVTAIASAFLDNVTTVVLIVPVTIYIAETLGVKPRPFLISEILAANIGGAATLIGDPPNILIGSAAGLGFNAFLAHMAPPALLTLGLYLAAAPLIFRRDLRGGAPHRERVLAMDERKVIGDPALLRKALLVLGATIGGFLLHRAVHLEPATVALTGAVVLLLWSGFSPRQALAEVEWTTLFFFIGLFIMVEGVVKVGLIDLLARRALALTGGELATAAFLVLWLSTILSGIVDNIPYTATMIPIVRELGAGEPGGRALWWALALGADFGGNATLIGASANIIVANLAAKGGQPLTFRQFLAYGVPVTLGSALVATLWVWLRYLA
ncbi:MAG: ArsB/NhaD family transporter [Chloroflexota bacterium]|nr:ArsB/NhaD family transporter [Chloroflexota bacterium]